MKLTTSIARKQLIAQQRKEKIEIDAMHLQLAIQLHDKEVEELLAL
jgi:hypothetical protein